MKILKCTFLILWHISTAKKAGTSVQRNFFSRILPELSYGIPYSVGTEFFTEFRNSPEYFDGKMGTLAGTLYLLGNVFCKGVYCFSYCSESSPPNDL